MLVNEITSSIVLVHNQLVGIGHSPEFPSVSVVGDEFFQNYNWGYLPNNVIIP
jgi:hypothetical protein